MGHPGCTSALITSPPGSCLIATLQRVPSGTESGRVHCAVTAVLMASASVERRSFAYPPCPTGDLPAAHGGRLVREGLSHGQPIELWKQRVGLVSPELQATYSATSCSLRDLIVSAL